MAGMGMRASTRCDIAQSCISPVSLMDKINSLALSEVCVTMINAPLAQSLVLVMCPQLVPLCWQIAAGKLRAHAQAKQSTLGNSFQMIPRSLRPYLVLKTIPSQRPIIRDDLRQEINSQIRLFSEQSFRHRMILRYIFNHLTDIRPALIIAGHCIINVGVNVFLCCTNKNASEHHRMSWNKIQQSAR